MILMVIIDVWLNLLSVKNIKGLWYVQLKSSIDITHTTYKPSGLFNSTSTILYDIEDRCKWVGDFLTVKYYSRW
jgi:hypothetical protein